MVQPASVRTTTEDGIQVVVASGEIDMATAPLLQQELGASIEAGAGPVVLDLCGLSFFDSSGLRVVLVAHRELAERERRLLVACPPDGYLRRTLTITGVAGLLELHPDRAAAVLHAA